MDDRTSTSARRDNLSAFSIGLAAMALLTAMVGVGFGVRAIDEGGTTVAAGDQPSSAPASASIDLTEFEIPDTSVATGGSLHVTNAGATTHNLKIEGPDLLTDDLATGASAHLELAGVAAGTYTMFCTIPGHRESGMQGDLTVAAGPAAAAAETASATAPSHDGPHTTALHTTAWTTRP